MTILMGIKKCRGYLGIYDTVILQKAWCENCQCYSFVRKNVLQCCDEKTDSVPTAWKRESLATGIRHLPSAQYRRDQLSAQEHRCFYCQMIFGAYRIWGGKRVKIRIHWDHLVPFAYLQSNPDNNFVAACHICNGLKGSKVFQTVEEAMQYVESKRQVREHKMRRMSESIQASEETPAVLHNEVQGEPVE